MKYTGAIQIEEELELTNPTAYVEAIFTDDNGHKHSRLMKVDLTTVDVDTAVESNEILKQFS